MSRLARRAWPLLVGAALACASPTPNERLVEAFQEEDVRAVITERGVMVLVPDILFAFDSDALAPAGRDRIARMARVIRQLTSSRPIRVEGHADSVGSPEYNLELSFRRARSVADLLVQEGVEAERVTPQGFGESRPAVPNVRPDGSDDPEGRRLNRRVEVLIENL